MAPPGRRHRRVIAATATAFATGAALMLLGQPAGAVAHRSSPVPQVRVLSKGTAPRAPLRLALTAGTGVRAQMVLVESIDQKLAGQTLSSGTTPPLSLPLQADVSSVAADGTAKVSSSYPGASGTLASLAAVRASETLTARNQIVDSSITGTEGLGSTASQLTSQISNQLSAFSAPFPKQAVGAGARWEVASTAKLSGLTVHQTYRFGLVSRSGNEATITVQVVQRAPRQPAKLPGVPASAHLELTKLQSNGTGTMTLHLGDPLPVSSSTHTTSTQVFNVTQSGKRAKLDQKIEIDLKLTR